MRERSGKCRICCESVVKVHVSSPDTKELKSKSHHI